MRNIILVICLFMIVSVLVFLIPNNGDYIKTGKLYISEIVSSNNITIKDNMNESSDYIEIYNGYDYDINLEGYYLSDSEFDIKKWILPDVKIKSKEYLVIYASSLDTCDLSNRICHTNFNLSSQGEIVTLSDNNGNIISKVKYPKMDLDISYSYSNRKYILTTPTPYKKNSSNKYSSKDKIKYNIKITEYMTHNNRSHYDIYGNYYDWIEIYNEGEDVSLKNMYVSDDKSSLLKYKLPDVIIKKGESPVKAGGKLLVIDGGLSRSYQSRTGIAGYTLLFNSHGLLLSEHDSFDSVKNAVTKDTDIYSSLDTVDTAPTRLLIEDTDSGKKIQKKINDLRALVDAFRKGIVK